MARFACLALALALGAGSLSAQSSKTPDISKELAGVWEGPYQSEAVPPGNLKLTIARGPNKEWQATLEIFAEQPPTAGPIRDFKVEGNKVSFTQDVDTMTCNSSGTVTAGVLKGTAECFQNGALAITATFLLAKAKS